MLNCIKLQNEIFTVALSMNQLINVMLVYDYLSRVGMVVYTQSASITINKFHGIFQFEFSMSNIQSIYHGIKYKY